MTRWLIFDCESVPDGRLVRAVKYPGEPLSDEEAVAKAQREALEKSGGQSEFLPVTFQVPVAVCVAAVDEKYRLELPVRLDGPRFRPAEITRLFWGGMAKHVYQRERDDRATVVSFNGRAFDFPLMEMAAFRYGLAVPGHFIGRYGLRDRYGEAHLDLMEFFTNLGSLRWFTGGLNLLAKLLGKPGKMGTTGEDVYGLYRAGDLMGINDYCSFDVLDTYFVFLRSRVIAGVLPLDQEQEIVRRTREQIEDWSAQQPHFKTYLDHWGDWAPWI